MQTIASLACALLALVACASPAPGPTEQPDPSFGTSIGPSPTFERPSTVPSPSLAIRPSVGLYMPTESIPDGPLGSILRSEALEAPVGVRAWAVLYRSTGFDGKPTAVSGIVLAPDGAAPSGGRRIVAWGHGSRGLSDDCAPSHEGAADLMPVAQPFLDMGYMVAATDYEGLGTPGPHPFLVGLSEGRAVLDIARAARLLPGADASTEIALLGHSQGGHAVLWASELAPTYAQELRLVGVIAIAPVGDLSSFVTSLRRQGAVEIDWLIGLQLASAWHDVYGLNIADVLGEEDQERAVALPAACPDFSLTPPAQPFAKDLATVPGWREQLAENTPGSTRAIAPLLIVHGTADEMIPIDTTRAEVRRLCKVGDAVEFQVIEGADHGDPLWADGRLAQLAQWIWKRFEGSPATSNCGSS